MAVEDPDIKEITDKEGLKNSARVIRESFKTVAVEFKLTKKNCPTHPSFVTTGQLDELKRKGVKLFGLFLVDRQVGFVAVEKAGASLYYMEKLAVLPKHRHRGYGMKLTEFAFDYIRLNKGKNVSIGIIDEHTVLKNWYKEMGFRETSTREYSHLPFTVCFMEREVSLLTAPSTMSRYH
jgi:ribosomal protein S18 acetylase RimI-like enzyme